MILDKVFETFPTLETENQVLRRIQPMDADALFAILSDDEVPRYYYDDTFTDQSCREFNIRGIYLPFSL